MRMTPKEEKPLINVDPDKRLVVKPVAMPLGSSLVLGNGLDVTKLPEGHLTCGTCKGHRFECWMYGDNRRIEMGCIKCGSSQRLVLPMDVKLGSVASGDATYQPRQQDCVGEGRFTCKKHPDRAMILIHNVDVVSIGCEKCRTEINICLRKSKGIVLADG